MKPNGRVGNRVDFWEIVELWQRGVGSHSYGAFLGAFMRQLAVGKDTRRWVEKTPWHIAYLREVHRDFPAARFIHIVRDPRDIALSVLGAGWIDDSDSRIAVFALSWQWYITTAERFLMARPGAGITVRYEDLVLNPAGTLARLGDFLGIGLDSDVILGSGEGVLSQSNTPTAIGGPRASRTRRWGDGGMLIGP